MSRFAPRKKIDRQIVQVVDQHQSATVRAICGVLFPELSWEDACTRVRRWPAYAGAIASTAWIVHWRCRILCRRRILVLVDRILTDRFLTGGRCHAPEAHQAQPQPLGHA